MLADMVGIDINLIEHGLNIHPGESMIKQKKQGQVREHNKSINLEVEKLVDVDILYEVFFPVWIASPLMVKKGNVNWMMCIDYSDLNKACPKDSYPLPEIDQKVE